MSQDLTCVSLFFRLTLESDKDLNFRFETLKLLGGFPCRPRFCTSFDGIGHPESTFEKNFATVMKLYVVSRTAGAAGCTINMDLLQVYLSSVYHNRSKKSMVASIYRDWESCIMVIS